MTIPAIRPTNIMPPKPAATAGVSRAKTSIDFPLAQLSRLSVSKIKLGPLTCREWDRHYTDCFNIYWHGSDRIRNYFTGGLSAFLSAPKGRPSAESPNVSKMRYQLQLEMACNFVRHISGATGLSHEEVERSLPVFEALKELSVKVRIYQNAGKPISEAIRQANGTLKKSCENLGFELTVAEKI